MTVATTTNRISYACDGATTAFPYTFKVFEDSDLEVILRTNATGAETTLTLTTHYTVSGARSASGGNVTTVATYSADYTLVIRRVLPLTQETDYITGDSFPADSHENALDRLVMIAQQLYEELGRALVLAASSSYSDLEIPDPTANQYLKWNAAGTALENAELTAMGDINDHNTATQPHQAGGWYADNAATGPVLLATDAEVAAGNDASKVVTPAGLKALVGYETVFIPAGAFMELGGNNSGSISNYAYPSSDTPRDYIELGHGSGWQGAQVLVGMPEQWDGATLKGMIEWSASATPALSNASQVCFGLQARPSRNGVTIDDNLSTPPAYIGDTVTNEATATAFRTAATGNFATAAGLAPEALDLRLTRNNVATSAYVDANNNASASVYVHGVWLQYRVNGEVSGW